MKLPKFKFPELHNPFNVAYEQDNSLLMFMCVTSLFILVIVAFTLMILFPMVFIPLFSGIIMLRVGYAVFKGK